MKLLSYTSIALLVLACADGLCQPLIISSGHINDKEKFTTTVALMNGEKYHGKLVECSDSSITLTLYKSYEGGHFYYERKFHYKELNYVMLKRKSKGIGTSVATPIGFGLGMAVVGIVDATTRTTVKIVSLGQTEPRKVTPGGYLAGGFIGAAVGAGIGIAIDQSSRKKYMIKIYGDYGAFAANVSMLKQMVISE